MDVRNHNISEQGFAPLRRAHFLHNKLLLTAIPYGESIYRFMNIKCTGGNLTESTWLGPANKFLRIYDTWVKVHLVP